MKGIIPPPEGQSNLGEFRHFDGGLELERPPYLLELRVIYGQTIHRACATALKPSPLAFVSLLSGSNRRPAAYKAAALAI